MFELNFVFRLLAVLVYHAYGKVLTENNIGMASEKVLNGQRTQPLLDGRQSVWLYILVNITRSLHKDTTILQWTAY